MTRLAVITGGHQGVGLGVAEALHAAAATQGVRILHETTVGAGLPVMDSFAKLVETGDQVLRIVGKRLREVSKEGITAYRLGGEEFALLVPGRVLALTRQMAESLRRVIERMSLLDRKSGRRIDHITASFGVGEYNGQETADALIERTDKLLYKAKELGRNRVMPLPS